MTDQVDVQLFILYLIIALATLALYPGSPCARNPRNEKWWDENLQVFLMVLGISSFFWSHGFWIAVIFSLHLIYAGTCAWGKWRWWALSWLMQAAVFCGWLVLNPSRPVGDLLPQ